MADLTFMHCASNILPADISVGPLQPLKVQANLTATICMDTYYG